MEWGGFLPWVGDVQGGSGLGAREGACRAAGLGAGNAVTAERCRQCDSSALPKSAITRISVHTCTTTYVFILLPRESIHFPIHLHASFSVSILHRCAALYRIVSAPIYSMCQINSSLSSLLSNYFAMLFPAQGFNYILKNKVK